MRRISFTVIGGLLLLFFQSCGGANFSVITDPSKVDGGDDSNIGLDDPTDDPNDPGLDGGHFDLDTSSRVYAFDQGDTDKHVHEYDDKYNVSHADFFNFEEAGFTQLVDTIGATQQFIIIVANAQNSPGGILEINGVNHAVTDYQKKVDDFRAGAPSLQAFTLTGANPLTSLKMKFRADAIKTGGLVPTQTKCVVDNKAGAGGEYRNGALTVQILDAATAQLDPGTKTATATGGLLWEATIFWHKDGAPCR